MVNKISSRNNYWSLVKGLCILTVLAIHFPLSRDINSLVAARQLINYPVAVFVFLSGYFSKDSENYVDTLKSVSRFLWPYLIWSSFWLVLAPPYLLGIQLFTNFAFGGFSILYFLFVLIQLKFITPWIFSRVKRVDYHICKDPLLLITPLYLLLFSCFKFYFVDDYIKVSDFISLDNFFPAWFLYYYLGILLKVKEYKIRPIFAVISFVVSLFVSINMSFWLVEHTELHNFPYTQSKLTSLFVALSFILLIYSIRENDMPQNILSRIGEWSFGIYILHMPMAIVFHQIVKLVTFLKVEFLLVLLNLPLVKYIVILVLTLMVIFCLQNFLPKKLIRILGIQ